MGAHKIIYNFRCNTIANVLYSLYHDFERMSLIRKFVFFCRKTNDYERFYRLYVVKFIISEYFLFSSDIRLKHLF